MKLIDAIRECRRLGLTWLTIDKNGYMCCFKFLPSTTKRHNTDEWHSLYLDCNYNDTNVKLLDDHEYPVKDWTKCIINVNEIRV